MKLVNNLEFDVDNCDLQYGVYCVTQRDFDNGITVEEVKSINKAFEEAGINNPNFSDIRPVVGRNRWRYKN